MKDAFQRHAARVALMVPLAALLYNPFSGWAGTILGSAQSFAVLGASTVTNTGATTIYRDLGLYPGTSITGFFGTTANEGPGLVTGGVVHQTDGVAQLAQSDALAAYTALAALSYTTHYLIPTDLGGLTLSPGVYLFDSSVGLTGALTLDFLSNPGGSFVFQIASTLITGSSSSVNVINGSPLSGVYWQVGSSATLGTSSTFAGNIVADQSITLNTSARIICGRAIALHAAVTMDTNTISGNCAAQDFGSGRSDFGSLGFSGGATTAAVPEPGSLALLGMGLGVGFLLLRKFHGPVDGATN